MFQWVSLFSLPLFSFTLSRRPLSLSLSFSLSLSPEKRVSFNRESFTDKTGAGFFSSERSCLYVYVERDCLFRPVHYICTADRAESISAFGFSGPVRWRAIKLDEDHAQWNGRVSLHRDQWSPANSQQEDHRGRRMWVGFKDIYI